MSASKCAKCDLTVYPVEGLRCLDKIWHKGCFKCHECNMTLNMKNYKGFEKRPYCNAHCPQAKATTVADTPEIRRLAENTRIQSQAKYHEDFEKSKGKGFTAIADDPETLRLKNTSKIISNVAYHGELERKKQMEEKRGQRDDEILNISINKHPNRSHNNNNSNGITQGAEFVTQHQVNSHVQYHPNQQQLQQQQQLIMQQKQLQQKQKQQQQQQHHHHHQNQQQILKQQVHYAQDLADQPVITRQVSQVDGHLTQQQATAKHSQQFSTGSPHHHHHHNQQQQQQQLQQQQQQQQILSRQQQQQLLLQQQQHRQSIDMSLPINRHQVKHHQSTGNNNNNIINNNNNNLPQAIIKNHMMPAQSHHHQQQQLPVKYVVANDPSARNLITGPPPHIVNQTQLSGIPNGQRIATNAALIANPQVQHHMMQPAFNHQQISGLNVAMPKQQHYMYSQQQPRHPIHPSQMQQLNHHNVHQQHHHHQISGSQLPPAQQQQHQVTRRVFRAMFDYVANDVDEVSFFENDILIDCVNVDGNWLIGKVARSGQTGMLPANYVAELTSQ